MVTNFEQLSDVELLNIGNALMNQLMDASTRQDYQAHIQDFSKRAKSVLDETQFKIVCGVYQEKNGFFTEREFVALFRRPDSVAFIWKQHYSKVEGDYVAEMVMIIEDGEYKVDHAFVF
ncbi:hypothetical protein [Acinetobacter shaoyimingii]|uniref:Uncharacterized protein n=1 Tax=Acinetobacter shaoyimingii TaxID=2715164 RepID=A0A6G8RY34_9GAMM|nr:hypothetical protein [Acinetobacter shaoyimingii]QIO06774.1 hypothetical protein G8E00_12890 [Acinetobacter shaoyimingii]